MYMSYNTNPHMPNVRRDAVRLVCYRGWSIRKVARHIGVEPSTVSRWVKLDPTGGWRIIPTRSSRPHHHPRALSKEMVLRILNLRQERNQCAEILHHRLITDGYMVSLSSVKRVLRRHHCSRYSRWKKWHQYPERPNPEKPGILVEIDTIHDGPHEDRLYVYTILDVCSRFAHALPTRRINTHHSLRFVREAHLPFPVRTLQSDHGPEFSKWFTKMIATDGVAHRHSRVRRPNDNAHLERFNRTIQEECLSRIPRSLKSYRKEIPEYLHYYNTERPHMGLSMKTPAEVLRSY
jgi:transposase InsO family protein